MNRVERLTITITPDVAEQMREAVKEGDYASASEIVREAMRDWRHKRAVRANELAALRDDIAVGLADAAAGRTKPFDAAAIIAKGKARR